VCIAFYLQHLDEALLHASWHERQSAKRFQPSGGASEQAAEGQGKNVEAENLLLFWKSDCFGSFFNSPFSLRARVGKKNKVIRTRTGMVYDRKGTRRKGGGEGEPSGTRKKEKTFHKWSLADLKLFSFSFSFQLWPYIAFSLLLERITVSNDERCEIC
jgi:hypothetical protein